MLQGKLGETKTKLAQVGSMISACDKGLADLKETMKGCEQTFYNMDFTDAKNSYGAIVFEARIFKRLDGNCVRSEPS